MFVLKLDVRYHHFFKGQTPSISKRLRSGDVIIVPTRDHESQAKSFESFPRWSRRFEEECIPIRDAYMPQLRAAGAHFIDIEKSDKRFTQVDALLRDLNLNWTPAIQEYVDAWEPIGSQHNAGDPRSQLVLEALQ